MEPKKVTPKKLEKVFEELKKGSNEAIGNYLYKGYRIQVSRYKLTTSERVSQLYHRRRQQGCCIVCGEKVKQKNPRTGKLYRLCNYHREKIDRSN